MIIGMRAAPINPGTIRKPPPMPKKPDIAPTSPPIPSRRGNSVDAVARPSGLKPEPSPALRTSIIAAITIISTPNSSNSF